MSSSAAIERLAVVGGEPFSAVEAAIHLNRYLGARAVCAGKIVLDVACGEGYGTHLMAECWGAAEAHGIDASAEAIDRARELFGSSRITFHQHAAEELDAVLPPGRFDLVVSLETIEHLDDPYAFLQGLKYVLRPQGGMLLSCPNDHWYYRDPQQSNPFHKRKYTFQEFRELSESVLGRARAFLLGTPAAGYINLPPDDGMVGCDTEDYRAILRARDLPAALVPTGERITWENCSYFLGIWGDVDVQAVAGASIFACAMDSSEVAIRQAQVEQLRDADRSLRQRLADLQVSADEFHRVAVDRGELERLERRLGLRVAALQAENELLRQELWRQRGTIDTLTQELTRIETLTRENAALRAEIGLRPALRHRLERARRVVGQGKQALRRLFT